MSRKNRRRTELLEYWGNPENYFLSRTHAALEVLKYSDAAAIYKTFTPAELTEIEAEAMESRRRKTARQRAHVYTALYNEAIKGNVQAAKEFLDRTEGKVTEKVDVTTAGKPQDMVVRIYGISADGGPPEEQRKRLEERGEYHVMGKQKLLEEN